jgi:hypothetical protein
MGGVAFAAVLTGSTNNPTRPKGVPTITGVGVTNDTQVLINFQNIPNRVPCNGGTRGVHPGNNVFFYTGSANTGQTGTNPGVLSPGATGLIQISGLTPNTVYAFTVTGTNKFGISDPSLPFIQRTDTIAEAPVIGAITTGCTTASAPVTVTTFDGGRAITQTRVNISPGGTPFTNPGSAPFTAPFSGLSPGVLYTFTAFHTTAIGTGRENIRTASTKSPVTINSHPLCIVSVSPTSIVCLFGCHFELLTSPPPP